VTAAVAPHPADAQAELDRLDEAIEAAADALHAAEAEVAALADEAVSVDELEGDVALGTVDPDAVAAARAEAASRSEAAGAEVERHRAALRSLRARRPAAERAVAEAKLAQITDELAAGGERRHDLSAKYGAKLKAADSAGREFAVSRAEVDALERAARELAGNLGFAAPVAVDEVDWRLSDLASFVAFASGMPRRPDDAAVQAAAQQQSRERDDVGRVAREISIGNEFALSQLPERLHADAYARARELYDEANQRVIAQEEHARTTWSRDWEVTTVAERIAAHEADLILQAANQLADYGIDENAPALRKVPPHLRGGAIEQAKQIRRDRLAEFERRNNEIRDEQAVAAPEPRPPTILGQIEQANEIREQIEGGRG
jgi:hypothetical protein